MGLDISTHIHGVQKTIEKDKGVCVCVCACLGTAELEIKTFTFQFYRGYFPSKFCILEDFKYVLLKNILKNQSTYTYLLKVF